MKKTVAVSVLILWLAIANTAGATSVLSMNPVGEHSCIAAPISLQSGQALTGISWLNNDSTVPFPSLLLLEGVPGLPPDLNDVGLVLYEVSGAELASSEVDFPMALTSTTGFVWAVWVLPAASETTGLGDGEGPGIGLEEGASDPPFYVSGDGLTWMRWAGDQRLSVLPDILQSAARTSLARASLAEMAGTTRYLVPEAVAHEPEDAIVEPAMRLHAPSPNPFNPSTVLAYEIDQAGPVKISVYNVRGRLVRTLVNETMPGGPHEVVWTGLDNSGKRVTSGVYYVRLEANGREMSRRMTLVR